MKRMLFGMSASLLLAARALGQDAAPVVSSPPSRPTITLSESASSCSSCQGGTTSLATGSSYGSYADPNSKDQFWVSADYLQWWFKGDKAPPLVTSGNPANFPAGALGQPGTSIIHDGTNLTPSPFSGARFVAGM